MKALISGALAGVLVDLILYPLDTIKTRLQAANGFFLAGGFTGLSPVSEVSLWGADQPLGCFSFHMKDRKPR